MNTFKTVICTDYGDVDVQGDAAQIIDRAPKRKDCQPDRRFTYGKLAAFVIAAVMDRKKAEYLRAH